jgi:hypothetical protein
MRMHSGLAKSAPPPPPPPPPRRVKHESSSGSSSDAQQRPPTAAGLKRSLDLLGDDAEKDKAAAAAVTKPSNQPNVAAADANPQLR